MPSQTPRDCRWWRAAALLALGLLANLQCAAAAPGPAAPPRRAMLIEAFAGLSDEVYLRRDDEAVLPLPVLAIEEGFQGLLLGAPRRVDAHLHPEFSALVLSSRSAARSRDLPWLSNAMLVATDVGRGEVFAGPVSVMSPDKIRAAAPTPQPPAPPGDPRLEALGEGSSAGTVWVNVPERLRLAQRSAQLVLRVIYFDQVSNPVAVDVLAPQAAEGALPFNTAMAVVERLRVAGQSQHRLPVFKRGPSTPPLDGPGVAFTIGRIGTPLPLHAAMRIEIAPAMQVQAAAAAGTTGGTPPPAALLRAAVLVVIRDHNEPYIFPIEVPVWSPTPLVLGQAVEAAFSIDLATLLPPAAVQPGAQVYLLAGRHIAGPRALTR